MKLHTIGWYLASLVCVLPNPGNAQSTGTPAPGFWETHKKFNDTTIKPTWWQIDTNGKPGDPVPLAMYRLALFAKHYQFRYINIVDARRVLGGSFGEIFWAKGAGSNFAGNVDCEASGRFVSYCRQYDVDILLTALQTFLSATNADTAAELAKLDLKYPIVPAGSTGAQPAH